MARDRGNLSESEQVAETAMPGWKAVKETSLTAPSATDYADPVSTEVSGKADSVMPTTEELKKKYLGARPRSEPSAQSGPDAAADEADTALVEMESGPLKKTVAISKSRKKVIWSQG